MNRIEEGQYWLLNRGTVVFVKERGPGDRWICNRVEPDGSMLDRVGEDEEWFERQLEQDEALEIIQNILTKKALEIMELLQK